ncbi:MAG: AMP-dependent synthetase, partial [Propionibacteriaceae bacterium]|nr:AMP-dependent synthetase [Propionibacteriaceae bacterium]
VFAHARENLAGYQLIRLLEFVDELPKTISGKIRRVELRDRESARVQAAADGGPAHFSERDFR